MEFGVKARAVKLCYSCFDAVLKDVKAEQMQTGKKVTLDRSKWNSMDKVLEGSTLQFIETEEQCTFFVT